MMYVGIDNGKQGGIVVIDDQERIIQSLIMPIGSDGEYDIKGISNILFKYGVKDILVMLEKAHTMPLNGAKANFTNGYQYGIIQALLQVGEIPYEIVSAAHWQKFIFQGMTVKNTKEASAQFVLRKYPQYDWKKSERCKKVHDGMTDACCIALYGLRRYGAKRTE